jgi:hypothetical protein
MGIIISPTDYDDWRWTGSAAAPPTGPADLAEINGSGIYGWRFTNGEALFFPDQQLPHDYAEGTDVIPHLHWAPSTTATYTGTWTLEIIDYLSAAPNAALQAKTTLTLAFDAAMTAYQMQTANFSAVLTGTNRKISSILHARLSLALSAGTSCFLNGLDAHYQKDRFGSVSATSKT